jgi:hypothetical protein
VNALCWDLGHASNLPEQHARHRHQQARHAGHAARLRQSAAAIGLNLFVLLRHSGLSNSLSCRRAEARPAGRRSTARVIELDAGAPSGGPACVRALIVPHPWKPTA